MRTYKIVRISAEEVLHRSSELGEVLADCVNGGASVSFMLPFEEADGRRYFESLVPSVRCGDRILLCALDNDSVVGTVQVVTGQPANQVHRVDVVKLLVKRAARGQGIATALMTAAEEEIRNSGKTLAVLDTASGSDAERLYAGLGWNRTGVIPDYAYLPDGTLCATTIFWKSFGS